MIIPIILAGGSGTRLWPLSNIQCPKQFLALINEETLLQSTLQRVSKIKSLSAPIIVCNISYRFLVAQQAQKILLPSTILLEPEGRSTAPAILLSALYLLEKSEDALMWILPSDQHIVDLKYLSKVLKSGIPLAEAGKLMTFGIVPTKAHTGYGYIRAGKVISGTSAYHVEHFVEKPDAATAHIYMHAGNYYWNSGMFLFKASKIIEQAKRHAPQLLTQCKKTLKSATLDPDFVRFNPADMHACENISIDNAIMEKTNDAALLAFDSPWADLGDWSTVWEVSTKDKNRNVIKGNAITLSTENSYIHSESRLIVAIGVKDHIIIETADTLLVAHKNEGQQIKTVVNQLSQPAPMTQKT